jgi:hypothetical protein
MGSGNVLSIGKRGLVAMDMRYSDVVEFLDFLISWSRRRMSLNERMILSDVEPWFIVKPKGNNLRFS